MTREFQRCLWIGLFACSQYFSHAQDDPQALYEVGLPDSLYSQILDEPRTIYVHFPISYTPGKNQKYPVAFILDGEKLLPTVSIFQDYYSGGFTPEMILIGISNNNNRTRDLTPSAITSKYGMPFTEASGEADSFVQFLEKELIPFVEKKYPVSNYRTLVGHSYGGLFVIYTLLNHQDLFTNYLSIDPSLDWDDQRLLKEARTLLTSGQYENKSLYMTLSGQLHMQDSKVTIDNVMSDTTDYTLFARSIIAFSELAEQNTDNGLSFDWKFYPKDLHGTISLPSIIDGLITIFEWYQMDNTDRINSFDTQKKELISIIKNRENKLKNHFGYFEPPYPEDLLNMSGYMNMHMNQLDKAKMYFEFAIEYYPESPNVYDSMADYYETQNDYQQALYYAEKAYELNNSDYYKNRVDDLRKKK